MQCIIVVYLPLEDKETPFKREGRNGACEYDVMYTRIRNLGDKITQKGEGTVACEYTLLGLQIGRTLRLRCTQQEVRYSGELEEPLFGLSLGLALGFILGLITWGGSGKQLTAACMPMNNPPATLHASCIRASC